MDLFWILLSMLVLLLLKGFFSGSEIALVDADKMTPDRRTRGRVQRRPLTGMFVDTNVLVAARFVNHPEHLAACRCLDRAGNSEESLHISRQIVREYLAAVTRSQIWSEPLAMADALEDAMRLISSFSLPSRAATQQIRSDIPGTPRCHGDDLANRLVASSPSAVNSLRRHGAPPVAHPSALCRRLQRNLGLVGRSVAPRRPITTIRSSHHDAPVIAAQDRSSATPDTPHVVRAAPELATGSRTHPYTPPPRPSARRRKVRGRAPDPRPDP